MRTISNRDVTSTPGAQDNRNVPLIHIIAAITNMAFLGFKSYCCSAALRSPVGVNYGKRTAS